MPFRNTVKQDESALGRRAARAQADARGVPADIMLPRIVLVVSSIMLVLIGLVMVFSASTVEAIADGDSVFSYVGKQAVFVVVGAMAAFAVARILPYHLWRSGPLFYLFWGLAMVLLVAVLFVGTTILGAQRWIYIGPFSLQPTEFAKIILVIGAARIMCDVNEGAMDLKQAAVWFLVLVLAPLGFLFVTQSDMGSAIIILMGIFAVAWLGEVPSRVLLVIAIAIGLAGAAAMSTGYRAERVAVWLNPWNDGMGGYDTGFQLIHSYYAFAQGGIFGVGLGNSREKFLYLPEAETDFIFSIIGEELGLLGAATVIALFVALLYAGLRIAAKAPDEFGRILAGSLIVMLVGQAFLNMACATGLFPTTGKPLPFISSGGSSVISSLLIVGVIMSVSYGSNVLTPYERRRNNLSVLRVDRGDAARPAKGGSSSADRGASVRRSGFDAVRGNGARNESLDARDRRGASTVSTRQGSSRPSRTREDTRDSSAAKERRRSSERSGSSDLRLGTGRDRAYFDERKGLWDR